MESYLWHEKSHFRTPYHATNVKTAVDTQRLATSLSLTCQEVRLICSEGLTRCFGGFVSPRNCLWIQFWPRVSLGAILATVRLQHSGRLSGIKQAYSVLTLIVYKICCLYHTDLQSTLTLIVYKLSCLNLTVLQCTLTLIVYKLCCLYFPKVLISSFDRIF